MAPKVVYTVTRHVTPYAEEMVKSVGGTLVGVDAPTEEKIVEACHDADACIGVFEPYTRNVIEKLARCQIIASIGIGYDRIDVPAATEHGIIVTNVPDYCLEEVSDHAMALLLAVDRKLFKLDRMTKQGRWGAETRVAPAPMSALRGQTLGLVGFGRIPRTLVRKAQAFGMKVIVYDPYVPKASTEGYGIELVDLDRLLRESDFVSVHAALTPENRHMFGPEEFKKMKKTAYFINTARGGLVDEKALYAALAEGWIQGAALDVMEQEPPPTDHPLFKLENIIITAHTAQYSDAAYLALRRRPIEEVARVLRGEWPYGWVNPQVREKFLARWKKPMKETFANR